MSQAIEVRVVEVAKLSHAYGQEVIYLVEFPEEATEMISDKSEVEMRLLKDDRGRIVSIILNRISE